MAESRLDKLSARGQSVWIDYLSRDLVQGGELKRLMLDHAFKFVERVVFVIGVTNYRSQKALEKIGGVRVGRRDKVVSRGIVESFVYEIRREKK